MVRVIYTLLLSVVIQTAGFSQTCCSGGVPLSSNLGLPAVEAQQVQLALSYDLNTLSTLKEGLQTVPDGNRNRKTHSVLVQAGYSFTDQLSADVLFSLVRQQRTITTDVARNLVQTEGIGDLVLLLKYRFWENRKGTAQWTAGLGAKLPTGATDRTNELGLLLNADLQPGSGATDVILWSQFTQNPSFRPSMSSFVRLTHSRRGPNNNYLPLTDPTTGTIRAQQYQFGNEWMLIAGISDRLLLGKLLLDPSLNFRFRSVQFDQINDQRLPNTGGTWWFVNPGVSWWAGYAFSVNLNAEFPLYANITGIQLSPSFRLNAGVFYRFDLKDKVDLPREITIF